MNRRILLLTLVTILVATAAVPALGAGTETVTPTFDTKASTRALAKARLALLTARSAQGLSRNAFNNSKTAKEDAATAKSDAAAAKATLESLRIQSASAAGSVSTESESYVQLEGGPSLTVDAPSSGLIEVWAQATFEGEGAVGLFEDGKLMSGQSEHCAPEEEGAALLSSFIGAPITLATPSTFSPILPFCGVEGPPAGVLFQTTPGKHTYELRYQFAECGCGGGGEPATFSKRLLRVAPRL